MSGSNGDNGGGLSHPENNGGSGDVYSVGCKRDRLERLAVRQRWPIPADKRQEIMDRAVEKLLSKSTTDRNFNQTLRAVIAAEAQNQADEHKIMPDELNVNVGIGVEGREDALSEVARRLLDRKKRVESRSESEN